MLWVLLAMATSFCFGFAFKTITIKRPTEQLQLKRVTGIGGIFFKCKDPKKVREWYQTHLVICQPTSMNFSSPNFSTYKQQLSRIVVYL